MAPWPGMSEDDGEGATRAEAAVWSGLRIWSSSGRRAQRSSCRRHLLAGFVPAPLLSSGASTPLRSSQSRSSTCPAKLAAGRRSLPPLPHRPSSAGSCRLTSAPVPGSTAPRHISPDESVGSGKEELRRWQVGSGAVSRVRAGYLHSHKDGNR
jgi:hypothetical protein